MMIENQELRVALGGFACVMEELLGALDGKRLHWNSKQARALVSWYARNENRLTPQGNGNV